MNSFPAFPPDFPLVVVLEFLYGLGYNQLVRWVHAKKLWHVSTSVMFGVAGTIIIPLLFDQDLWNFAILYFVCFMASGVPMVWGSLARSGRKSHKRRRLPNYVMTVRDDVVMELNVMADEIVNEKTRAVDVVHRIHKLIGTLKSL